MRKKIADKVKKSRTAHAATGAISSAAIPASLGVVDWRILAGAAAIGAIGGFFGLDVASAAKKLARE